MSRGWLSAFVLCCAGAAVLMQVAYPLVGGDAQRMLTILSVVAFCAFSTAHAFVLYGTRGPLAVLGICGGVGLAIEAVGSRTGFPFGNYDYTASLGWRVLGVPVVVALAWAMMGWPAFLAARRVFGEGWRLSIYGAAILTAWDLLLDPQMVDAGHWVWAPTPGPALNEIPLVNSLGWFAVAFVMMTLLQGAFASNPAAVASSWCWPAWAMLAWTWFSETLGHLVFFGLPWVGVIGGLVFGAVLLPWARGVRADIREAGT